MTNSKRSLPGFEGQPKILETIVAVLHHPLLFKALCSSSIVVCRISSMRFRHKDFFFRRSKSLQESALGKPYDDFYCPVLQNVDYATPLRHAFFTTISICLFCTAHNTPASLLYM